MIIALLASCRHDAPSPAGGPTWTADVGPLVQSRCAACHVEGGVGPIPLADYASASASADRMATWTGDGSMPPWSAGPGCADYVDPLGLTADEVALFAAWADAGAPEGPPGTLPDAPAPLDRVDATAELVDPFTPTTTPDQTRCFLVPYDAGEAWVTGVWLAPGTPAEVRFARVFRVGATESPAYLDLDAADPDPGWDCSDPVDADLVGTWTAGQRDGRLPAGTGVHLAADDRLVLQVGYHAYHPLPDRSSIQLELEPGVDAPGRWIAVDQTGALGVDGEIGAVEAEADETVSRVRIDAAGTCLLDLPQWDPAFPRSYVLVTPTPATASDPIPLSCAGGRCLGQIYVSGP